MENKSFGEMWATLTEEQREYFAKYIDRQRQNAVDIYIEQQCNMADVVKSLPEHLIYQKAHELDEKEFEQWMYENQ
jgi:hypothetical protein